ncbi:MAG: hypothetical protein AAB653_02420 [Patescibacteria group bacterium]
MATGDFSGFNPKKYVAMGLGVYSEEIVLWEEKKTKQGMPVYLYTVKLVDKGIKVEGKTTTIDKPEVKEGVLFVNSKTRKITTL